MFYSCLKELLIQSFKNFILKFHCYSAYIIVLNLFLISALIFSLVGGVFFIAVITVFIYAVLNVLSYKMDDFLVKGYERYENFMKENIKRTIEEEDILIFALRKDKEKCGLTKKAEKRFLVEADVVFIVFAKNYFLIFEDCPKFSIFHPDREESHKGCGRKKACGMPKEHYYEYVQEVDYIDGNLFIIYNSKDRYWYAKKIECEKASAQGAIKALREKLRKKSERTFEYERL